MTDGRDGRPVDRSADAGAGEGPYEIAFRNVSFAYPTDGGEKNEAVRDISFGIPRGAFLSVIGPSGCGKSTLLRLIAGFLTPDTGVVLDEGSLVDAPDWRRGLVFQKPELFPWLTVEENIEFGLRMRSVPSSQRRERVRTYLSLVGLEAFGGARAYELSGGMQQRVALARGLVNKPHILLLDEPFGALDALTREQMQDELRRIHRESGCTMVLVTHSVEEAIYLSDRCIVLTRRPGTIRADIPISFQSDSHANGRQIKACPEFVALREQVLDLIWDQGDGVPG